MLKAVNIVVALLAFCLLGALKVLAGKTPQILIASICLLAVASIAAWLNNYKKRQRSKK